MIFDIFKKNDKTPVLPDEVSEAELSPEILKAQLEVVQTVSHQLINQSNLDETLGIIVKELVRKLNYVNPSIYILNEDKQTFSVSKVDVPQIFLSMAEKILGRSIYDIKFSLVDDNLFSKTIHSGQIQLSHNLYELLAPHINETGATVLQKTMNLGLVIVAPIILDSVPIGCLVLTKKESEITLSEAKVINTFCDQISIAIFNAQQTQESSNQITELEHKNADLQSLYQLTNNISSILDPNTVAQVSVNNLPQDETMFGAFLDFYDKNTGIVYMKALTSNPVSDQISKLVGSFDQYGSNVNLPEHQKNPVVQAVLTGQMQVSDDLGTIISPPMPAAFVPMIKKLINVSSVVVFPLKSRNDTTGTVTFLLRDKTFAQLEDNKKQLLATYALQISIALENAHLFTNLETALEQLKEARRKERDMLDVMGHELRTPISIVRNALLMLDRDYTKNAGTIDKEMLRRYLDMAIESVRREITLIETLLSATKVDASRMQLFLSKVDFKDVVTDGIEGQRAMLEQKGLQLIYTEPAEEMFVYADRTRTQEIMDNFMSNAAKYTNTGSITLSIWKDATYSWISIKDTGMGISEADLENLGKKFFRAKQYIPTQNPSVGEFIRPGGTGLGLYVAFDLIRIMGGKLYINSKVGVGSSFTFCLPIFANQPDKQIDETFSTDDVSKKEHVLINQEAPQPPVANA